MSLGNQSAQPQAAAPGLNPGADRVLTKPDLTHAQPQFESFSGLARLWHWIWIIVEREGAGRTPTWIATRSLGVVLAVGLIDYFTGSQVSVSVFYLLPITFASWYGGQGSGAVAAAGSAVAWFWADIATERPALPLWISAWNALSRLFTFLFVSWLLAHVRRLQDGLEDTIQKRTDQLEAETRRRVATEQEIASISQREQRRIAHELHDGLGQELGGLAFQAKLLASKLAERGNPIAGEIEDFVAILNLSIRRTRALSQLLDPVSREWGGLRAALNQLADQSGLAFDIGCTLTAPEQVPQLSAEVELHLYRIAQEAIHNAVKHGEATSVEIEVSVDSQALTMTIADTGRGFEMGATPSDSPRGMGLRIMQHRAAALDARVEVNSKPGQGCRVVCRLPLPRTSPAPAS